MIGNVTVDFRSFCGWCGVKKRDSGQPNPLGKPKEDCWMRASSLDLWGGQFHRTIQKKAKWTHSYATLYRAAAWGPVGRQCAKKCLIRLGRLFCSRTLCARLSISEQEKEGSGLEGFSTNIHQAPERVLMRMTRPSRETTARLGSLSGIDPARSSSAVF